MIDPDTLDWEKMGGLIPAIIQHRADGQVRMLGYVDRAALEVTLVTGLVTFFSRSKQRQWTKGENSGNHLRLVDASADCDGDSVLFLVDAEGPTCHLGTASCFGEIKPGADFLQELERRLANRILDDPASSYTARLHDEGVKRIAQKVGEEGVETALAAVAGDQAEFISEVSDLVYHLSVLLIAKDARWADVWRELMERQTGPQPRA